VGEHPELGSAGGKTAGATETPHPSLSSSVAHPRRMGTPVQFACGVAPVGTPEPAVLRVLVNWQAGLKR
jgi:hypothetical protein